MRSGAAQTGGREPDEWGVSRGTGERSDRDGWRRHRGGCARLADRLRVWVFRPNIIVPHRGGGVPKVAGSPRADRMNPEGSVNVKSDLMNGRGGRDLEGSAPLCTVRGLRTKLM